MQFLVQKLAHFSSSFTDLAVWPLHKTECFRYLVGDRHIVRFMPTQDSIES
jgi:hypothetical protein